MSSDNKNAIFAVIVSGIILFGWQHFFAPKNNTTPVVEKSQTKETKINETPSITTPVKAPEQTQLPNVLESFVLSNGSNNVTFTNNLEFNSFTSTISNLSLLEFSDSKAPLFIEFDFGQGFQKATFNWTRISDAEIVGKNTLSGTEVKLNLGFDGKLAYSFTGANPFKVRLSFNSSKKELDGGYIREFSLLNKDLDKISVGKSDEGEGETRWAGLDFNFHIFALTFKEKLLTTYKAQENGQLLVTTTVAKNEMNGSLVFAKKDYDKLTNLGEHLNLSIDYGMWSVIAVPILRALQFFYKYIPNYGIAIILLTLFIRLLTFPLQYKSFKSMKKMQEIQPELTKIREKYKEDPQRLQRETMDLFKKAGANPLGGCLPLLLQMPIFFAFYKVLFNSTELMGAPFMFWIKDLSIKDPFYVLPVLMAGAMFLQQKMTPTPTADPTQQKIMLFMPLVFALIMKDLPSGLTLYIFVSTILGIIQQLIVYKKS